MKNTIIAKQSDLVANYTINTAHVIDDFIKDDGEECSLSYIREFAGDISRLTSNDIETARRAFHDQFRQGNTMVLLNPEDCDLLEKWDNDKKEFSIVVVGLDNIPIGIYTDADVTW